MSPSFQKLMVMLMDRYTEAINISNDICQNHMKYPENRGGGPESGSLPGFSCFPTSYMAAISNQLQAAHEPSLQPWLEPLAPLQS